MAWHDVKDDYFEEKMLWLAVLRRTIFDYVLYDGVGAHSLDWKRAHQFLFENPLQGEGLCFEEVCALFEWSPGYIRRLIKKLTKDDVRKLESRRFKEEFLFDIIAELVRTSPKWDFVGVQVPFFPPNNYCEKYRQLVTLHTVSKEHIKLYVPRIKWGSIAA